MKIGIGLPNPIPGTPGRLLVDWARRAEERGFSTLATIDRIAYPSYESLIALAAAGAATERIPLMTNILLGPTRNPVLLAKEAASVDQVSGGRLTLGLAAGSREDDYTAVGQPFRDRGRRLDDAVELMLQAWQGQRVAGSPHPVTPAPARPDGIPLIFGGTSGAALARVLKWGIGWTAGGAGAGQAAPFVQRVRKAWQDGGRSGSPRFVGLQYFALGGQAEERGGWYIKDYYAFLPFAAQFAAALARTPDALRQLVRDFEAAGFDELIFDPTIPDLSQVDLLADAVAL